MQITKKQLKAQLEELLDKIENDSEDITIIDQGKPLFKIIKCQNSLSTKELFTPLRGKIKYYEDLTSPTTDEWTNL